jgi:nuclear pore complex protein Nup93
MQNKMMIYDQAISALNMARLRGISYPIVHALVNASMNVNPDVRISLPGFDFPF